MRKKTIFALPLPKNTSFKCQLMKKFKTAIILFSVFEAIAISLWLTTGSLFYLLNFTYIGFCIGVGLALSRAGWKYAREFIQFGVGAYMLVFLGLICREKTQKRHRMYPMPQMHQRMSSKSS